MPLLLVALFSLAYSSICFDAFSIVGMLDDDLSIVLGASDLQLNGSWYIDQTTSVTQYTSDCNNLFGWTPSDAVNSAISTVVGARMTALKTGFAALGLIDGLLFRTCLLTETTVLAAVDLVFVDTLDTTLSVLQWPTQQWLGLCGPTAGITSTLGALTNWITAFASQVTNRVQVLETYLLSVNDRKTTCTLAAYNAIAAYSRCTSASALAAAEIVVQDALRDLLVVLADARRLTGLLGSLQSGWSNNLNTCNQNRQQWISNQACTYQDFLGRLLGGVVGTVENVVGDLVLGVNTLVGDLKQGLLDFLAGLLIDVEADITCTVTRLADGTLNLVFNFVIPGVFDDLAQATNIGRQIQSGLVNWACVTYLLNISDVVVVPYNAPAQNDGKTMSVGFSCSH